MVFTTEGKTQFDSFAELTYYLFLEIGLGINASNNYVYDTDTMSTIQFKDKYLKATTNNIPIYAGQNEILFDPSLNFNLMPTLFGYFLDKFSADPDNTVTYIAHFTEFKFVERPKEKEDLKYQRVTVRTSTGDISTQWYINLYLAYIEAVFLTTGSFAVDLSNFDIERFKEIK